jgi:hypothetical protein
MHNNKFQGFRSPTTTPIPDEVFDELMADLTGAELKVLLYICRRTFGFKKESDTISLHQIAEGIVTALLHESNRHCPGLLTIAVSRLDMSEDDPIPASD